MDMVVFNEIVQGVGFPVAVCGALFWLNRETVKHYERVLLEFQNSIKSNTAALEQLSKTLGR